MSDLKLAEAVMPFGIYAAILSSQLIVTVADHVPEFNSAPYCRTYDAAQPLKDCLASEKQTHEKLTKVWSNYTAHDKAMCVFEEKVAGRPSYVGWLTCLDINANARRLDATKSAAASVPAAGTGGETGSKRGHRHRPSATTP
jgi:hypothetical protein